MRAGQDEAAWNIPTPILIFWDENKPGDFPNYAAGPWGPEAAKELVSGEGHRWPEYGKSQDLK
jgi:glucose-6-phosphate 1-dehydrogenase